jgi:hypothetical protein
MIVVAGVDDSPVSKTVLSKPSKRLNGERQSFISSMWSTSRWSTPRFRST